jgi:hypothetical protein
MSPVSSTGRAAASDSEIGNDARPGARRATSWEQFVIGLDRDFDQFRRTFGAQPADNGKANTENATAPSAWNHLRATDEAIASLWPEDEASSLAGRSGRPDPEGSWPVQVSLSQAALALGLGCALVRRPRPRPAFRRARYGVRDAGVIPGIKRSALP